VYLSHKEEEAKEMIHLTTARTLVGASVRMLVRYGPSAVKAYRSSKTVRSKFSRRDALRETRGSFVYPTHYTPEERWWE